MAAQLTTDDFKESLNGHVLAKGEELRAKYGPHIGWKELLAILQDRAFCRYPCEIVFDSGPLAPGEFAYPAAKGEGPESGFTMYVHPIFMTQLPQAAYLVLYQLIVVNYGEFGSADDAETFGAAALGLSKDQYYDAICEMAGQVAAPAPL
jgi:hypothetical protein